MDAIDGDHSEVANVGRVVEAVAARLFPEATPVELDALVELSTKIVLVIVAEGEVGGLGSRLGVGRALPADRLSEPVARGIRSVERAANRMGKPDRR